MTVHTPNIKPTPQATRCTDAVAWDYLNVETGVQAWAAACTKCGFNLADTDQATAFHARDHHHEPSYKKPFLDVVLTTSRGDLVTVAMTDDEAAKFLAEKASNFANDLAVSFAKYGSWTAAQRPWAHKLANEAQAAADAPPAPAQRPAAHSLPNVIARFETAVSNGATYPSIRLSAGLTIKFMTGGRNPGTVTVTDGGAYPNNEFYGRVQPNGDWDPPRNTPGEVIDALREYNADPAAYAAAYGQEIGSCCFCNRLLTHGDSVTVGYGPVCADKYGLPHGGSGV